MTALGNSISYKQAAPYVAGVQVPIYAAAKIYQGAMVCLRLADGYAVRAGTASTGRVIGVAQAEAAAPTASGDYNVNLLCGVFAFALHASRYPTIADVGKVVYASDDQTISNTASDGPVAGVLVGFEASSGWALVEIKPPNSAETGLGSVSIPFTAGILAAGTPMAAFADNASSNPGVTLNNSKAMGIRWNNNASQTAVWTRFSLPYDVDTSKAATLVLTAAKTGATVGDATTFTVAAYNQATGAAEDADTNFGGATSAMTGDAAAKTVQQVTLTLAAADLGVPGDPVSLSFKPTDGTLGTDDVVLYGMTLQYRRKS